MTKKIIEDLKAEQIAKLNKKIPEFKAGDTVRVVVRIVEEKNTRNQAFEGVVIARHNDGANSTFTVRKISFGEGVERVFPLYSPNIVEIKVTRRGVVNRGKLYYLRKLFGKKARITEDSNKSAE
ncbi:MAG: 50S ribosomal protein L19 [Alphaproteobacteria bacterium]|nr:50S ribosomal protein L19 [Alphaproteobacteria bacterium]